LMGVSAWFDGGLGAIVDGRSDKLIVVPFVRGEGDVGERHRPGMGTAPSSAHRFGAEGARR
jgi:hypothetical protein